MINKKLYLCLMKILVFKEGRLVQQGEPQNIYDWPINQFVGSFFWS